MEPDSEDNCKRKPCGCETGRAVNAGSGNPNVGGSVSGGGISPGPNSGGGGNRLQDALPVLKNHLRTIQSMQHNTMQQLFNEQTESSSSITFRMQQQSASNPPSDRSTMEGKWLYVSFPSHIQVIEFFPNLPLLSYNLRTNEYLSSPKKQKRARDGNFNHNLHYDS